MRVLAEEFGNDESWREQDSNPCTEFCWVGSDLGWERGGDGAWCGLGKLMFQGKERDAMHYLM